MAEDICGAPFVQSPLVPQIVCLDPALTIAISQPYRPTVLSLHQLSGRYKAGNTGHTGHVTNTQTCIKSKKTSRPPNWWALGTRRAAQTRRNTGGPCSNGRAACVAFRFAHFVTPLHLVSRGEERRGRIRSGEKTKQQTGGAEKSGVAGIERDGSISSSKLPMSSCSETGCGKENKEEEREREKKKEEK